MEEKYYQLPLYFTGAKPTSEYELRKIAEWGGQRYDRKSKGHQAALVTWRIMCNILSGILAVEALVSFTAACDIRTGVGLAFLAVMPIGLRDCCPPWFIQATKRMGGER